MHRVLDLVLERNEELEKKQEQFTALLIQHDTELRALLEQLNATLPQIRGELDTRLASAVPALVSEAYDGYNHELEHRCAAALSGAATKLDALRDEIAKLAAEKFSAAEKRVGVSLNEIEQRIKESVGASVELRAVDIERGLVLRISEELAKQAPKSVQSEKQAGLVELYRGQFSAGKTAKRGEVWTYLGGTYLALEDTTEFPSRRTVGTKRAFWALLAARGGGGGGGDTLPPQAGNSGKVLSTDGSALSWVDAGSGSGDALKSDPLSQFAATTSAQLAGVITDETGSGNLVFGTNPTLNGYNLTGARTITATTLAGTEIDVTKPESVKAISADTTLTFSATPDAGKEFRLTLNATGGPWVVTYPESYSPDRQSNQTTATIPSGGTVILLFRRTASRYEVFGLPPETVGSGTSFQMASADLTLETVPTVDGAAVGPRTSAFVSGYTSSAIGDLVYLDSAGKWQKCDATGTAAQYSGLLGIALAVAATDAALLVALPGSFVYSTAFPTLTVGGACYMGAAGAITQTAPTATDDAQRVIGHAIHADKIYFQPDGIYVVAA